MSAQHLIVFDVDGTLVDSGRTIVDAMAMAFRDHDLAPPQDEDVRRIVGLSVAPAIEQLLPCEAAHLLDGVMSGFKAHFQTAHLAGPGFTAYPGMVELVHHLHGAGYLLGIATGNSQRGLKRALEALGLENLFLTLQTADGHPSKPHPSMLHTAMEDVGVGNARTIMIGDTSFDMAMATAAGACGLGVSWGYHGVDELRSAGASDIARDALGLRRLLQRWSASE